MIHIYASEASAAGTMVLFVIIFFFLWYFRVGWSREATAIDVVVLILSCAFGCRTIAKGKACQWPAGVDFKGRVALVVGGSSGVGYNTAEQLAAHGWTVILTARNIDRLLYAKRSIERHLQRTGNRGEVKVLGTVDLRSDASIRSYAATLRESQAKLPIGLLVMAAGALHRHETFLGADAELKSGEVSVASSSREWRTMESMLASNAVGPFLLTQLVLPLLVDTAERSSVTSRIVNVGSSCHTFLGMGRQASYNPVAMIKGLDRRGAEVVLGSSACLSTSATTLEDIAVAANNVDAYYHIDFSLFNFVGYYGLSKLCVMWNTRLLAQQVAMMRFTKKPMNAARPPPPAVDDQAVMNGEHDNQFKVFVACVHPGIITTYLYRELLSPRVLDLLVYYPSLFVGKTWFEAAQSTLKAAVEDTGMVQGGYYLCGGEYGPDSGVNCVSAHAQNPAYLQEYRTWLMQRVAPAMETGKKTE